MIFIPVVLVFIVVAFLAAVLNKKEETQPPNDVTASVLLANQLCDSGVCPDKLVALLDHSRNIGGLVSVTGRHVKYCANEKKLKKTVYHNAQA